MARITSDSYLQTQPLGIVSKQSLSSSGRSINQKALVKFNAVSEKRHLNTHHTTNFTPTSTLFTAGAQLRGRVESASMHYMNSSVLRMTITMTSNPGQLVSCHNWFDKIEIYAQSGSRLLSTLYPEMLLFNLQQLPSNVLKAANIDPETYTPFFGDMSAGQTKTFNLPLPGSVLSQRVYFKEVTSDLVIHFTPRTGINYSGAGVPTCNSLDLICSNVKLTEQDILQHNGIHRQHIFSKGYLEATRLINTSMSLNASTEKRIELDNLNGNVAALLCAIYTTGASSYGDGYNQFQSIGPGSFDVLNPGGQSMWGSGSAVDAEMLKSVIWSRHFPIDFGTKRNLYMIPFSDRVRAAMAGSRSGSWKTDGSRHYLAITPSAAPTATVVTVTLSSTNCRSQSGTNGTPRGCHSTTA